MKSNPPLRVAIVGCGKIADCHAEAVRRVPRLASLVATCDSEPLMAEQLARRYGVEGVFSDFRKLLEAARPDVVHVTTPPAAHLPLAMMAIDAGKAVYVEKPLAPSNAQALELVRYAERRGVPLTVGYTYLFDPPALAVRRLIEEGVVGEPIQVESFYGYDLQGDYGRALGADPDHWVRRLPGGLVHNILDHLLNKLTEFVDDEDPRLAAMGQQLESRRDDREGMVDELRVLVAGRRVTGYASFSAHARPLVHACCVRGTRNTVQADFVARTVTLWPAPPLPSALGRILPAFTQAAAFAREGGRNVARFAASDFHFLTGLFTLVERFYEAVRGGGALPIAYRDILWVSRLIDRILAQLGEAAEAPTTRREVA